MIKSLTIWRNFTFMFHGQQTLEISRTFLSAMLGINYYKGILKPRSFVFLSFHHRAIVQWKFAIGKYKQKVQISVILFTGGPCTANVLSAKSTDKCLRTKSKDN